MATRFNLFAGPCAGKSTAASRLFSEMKGLHLPFEQVNEVIKPLIYDNKVPKGFDQLSIFAKQLNAEEAYLRNDVKNIVTDAPLLLVAYYTKLGCPKIYDSVLKIALEFEKEYPSKNMFLVRPKNYNDVGRIHSKNQADIIDVEIRDLLKDLNIPFSWFDYNDYPTMVRYMRENCE